MTTTFETTPLPHVRVLWRPEQFERCTNTGFETNTSGWSASASINAAATSITRITTDFHEGAACAEVVTTATLDSGVNFDLGADTYFAEAAYGTEYVAVVWLKRVSGSRQARITLGSAGTAADRGTVLITDLPDVWTPYRVVWMPSANRTDAELAITNGSAAILTFDIDSVSIHQLDAFSQVENANFITDTTGWSVGAGINAAGTSITQGTGSGFAYADTLTAATLVTTGTSGSGANYALGTRLFTSGRTYRARVALKSLSGSTSARLRLGSAGTGADRGDTSAFTITAEWAWYSVDWTPSADRTDVQLAVTNGSASAMTALVSCVEVYEAIDEIQGVGGGNDVQRIEWRRDLTATGTLNLTVSDPPATHRYTPWYTAGALYGLLSPGKRVWARATYQGSVIYPIAFGTIRRILPDAEAGTAQVMCEDPLYDLNRASFAIGFGPTSYADARALMFGAASLAAGLEPVAGDARLSLSLSGPESDTFYFGTNDDAAALDILENLNEATGSVHFIDPDARAEVMWRYTTAARPELTASTISHETVADDFNALTGLDMTDEALENTQSVTWQGYEAVPPPGHVSGFGYIVTAADVTSANAYETDDEDPYLHFVSDVFGTDDDVPEPTYEREWHWRRRRRKKGKKPIRVRVSRAKRVYPNPYVPFTLTAGDVREIDLDFSIPMAATSVTLDGPVDPNPSVVVTYEATPRHITVQILALATVTIDFVGIAAYPYLPLGERAESIVAENRVVGAITLDGPALNTPYVSSLGAAEGLGTYRNWRYGDARLRPKMTVEHRFPSLILRRLGEHLTVQAPRQGITEKVFVITGISGSSGHGALKWDVEWSLEDLPTLPADLFALDDSGSLLDGTSVLAY